MNTHTPITPGSSDDLDDLRAGKISVTTYARLAGREVPDWMTLDGIITASEMIEVEETVMELREFVQGAISLAEKVRRVRLIGNRFESRVDNDWTAFEELVGISEMAFLCDALHAILPGDDFADRGTIGDAQRNLGHLPDLELALEVVAGENHSEVPPLPE